jgi:hypothetical protein
MIVFLVIKAVLIIRFAMHTGRIIAILFVMKELNQPLSIREQQNSGGLFFI